MTVRGAYRFGPFLLDADSYRLRRDGAPLDLSPKALDLLFLLVRQPGRLVTKEDILAAVWPDVAVTDNALTQVISGLRQAIGDRPSAPTYIETVPRRGYRFIADVRPESGAGTPLSAASAAPAGAAGAAGPRSIGVADLTHLSRDPDTAWLSAGIAEAIAADLRTMRELRVFDRLPGPFATTEAAADAARHAGLDLVVAGSYQRAGARLRIAVAVLDVRSGEPRAQARVDGALDDLFALEDAVVSQLTAGLHIVISAAAAARLSARETASLDAYRAITGRLLLERLDPRVIPQAIEAFERAIAIDPRYALAQVGLGHARFWQFQATRSRTRPDMAALAESVAKADAAIALDPDLAEAHSARGFFLATAERRAEGVAACRRAVDLEPGNWRHQFRLGMAAWGAERLAWLEAVTAQYPALAYAYFGRAMVHVARGDLAEAEAVLRAGAANEQRATEGSTRFPASGLHWLLGLVRLAQGDAPGARVAFERELHAPGSRLFADEYAREAWIGQGGALLAGGDAGGAKEAFERALASDPDHPRALIGLAAASRDLGDVAGALTIAARMRHVVEALRDGGRTADAAIAASIGQAMAGQPADAAARLSDLLTEAPMGSVGWMLPVEPALAALRREPAWPPIAARLAQRAG